MARKTAHIISCDNPNCDVVVEVNDLHEHPEGWYRVYPNAGHERRYIDYFDLHSLECISKWAKLRDEGLTAVNGNTVKRTDMGLRELIVGSNKTRKEQLEETRELVLASVETGKNTVLDVAVDLGIGRATAARHLKALTEAGKLTVRNERLNKAARESFIYELVKE